MRLLLAAAVSAARLREDPVALEVEPTARLREAEVSLAPPRAQLRLVPPQGAGRPGEDAGRLEKDADAGRAADAARASGRQEAFEARALRDLEPSEQALGALTESAADAADAGFASTDAGDAPLEPSVVDAGDAPLEPSVVDAGGEPAHALAEPSGVRDAGNGPAPALAELGAEREPALEEPEARSDLDEAPTGEIESGSGLALADASLLEQRAAIFGCVGRMGKMLCYGALAAGILFYFNKLCCSEGCCDLRKYAWVRKLLLRIGVDKFQQFTVLCTVHGVADVEEGEYFAWVLAKRNQGALKPPKSGLKPSKGAQRTRQRPAAHCQERVILEVAQGRAKIQLAVFRSTRGMKDPKFIGSVCLRTFEDVLAARPREKTYTLLSDDKNCTKVGALKVSFYIQNKAVLEQLGFPPAKLSLPLACCLEQAALRLDKANAEAKLRGMKPIEKTRMAVLGRLLSGDLLKTPENGGAKRRVYFEIIAKKDRWFWIWYKGPHAGYEPSTFEDLGEVCAAKGEGKKKQRDIDAHVPLSAVAGVSAVKDDEALLVQYRNSQHERSDLILQCTEDDPTRGRDEMVEALKMFLDAIRESDPPDSAAPNAAPAPHPGHKKHGGTGHAETAEDDSSEDE